MTALHRIRETALAMPETEERVSHGQPSFFVAGSNSRNFGTTIMAMERASSASARVGPEEQAMLIEAAPETYATPAYLGAAGWVSMNLQSDVDWALVDDRIARSWELAAPQRLLEAGGR